MRFPSPLLLLTALLLAAARVHAQAVDYGALQQLFNEPVTTSVTGSPQRAADVPANMQIVTAEDIRRSGAYDIPGVLRHVVGVNFQQWTDDQAEISVRGYDQPYSQRLLVLINGRQVYSDYYGFTSWSSLPVELDEIRQIEIVKGPGSALFGFNAVGGVINIITYDPLYDQVDTASISAGSQQLAQGMAAGTFEVGSIGAARVAGGLRTDADFGGVPPAPIAGLDQDRNERREANLDSAFRLGSNAWLRVEASDAHAQQYQVNPAYQYDYEGFDAGSIKLDLSADSPLGLLDVNAYNNRLQQTSIIGVLGDAMEFIDRLDSVQADDIFKIGSSHTFRFALEYRHESTNTSPVGGGEVFYSVTSQSGMWNWQLTPKLALTNAVRVDELHLGRDGSSPPGYPFSNSDWDRHITQPSYNSGAVWKFSDADTLRALAARGAQLPNLVELGSLLYHSPYLGITGTPLLEPTVVDNYEIDWDHDLPQWRAHMRLALYDQDTADLIASTGAVLVGAGGVYATPQNVEDSLARGLEYSLNGQLGEHWNWGANLSLESVSDRFIASAQDGADLQAPEQITPKRLANVNLGWSGGAWQADGYLQYQSHTQGLLPNTTGYTTLTDVNAYWALDARLAYGFAAHLSLALSGQNLLESAQQQTSGALVERRWLLSLSGQL